MKRNLAFLSGLILILLGVPTMLGQSGFRLSEEVKRTKIKFELVNNLVVLPVKVNGTPLNFILDSGVNATILFAFKEVDSVEIKNVKPVKLKGLGEGGSVDALRSEGNLLEIGETRNNLSTLYVIFDEDLDFSTRMGTSINGIIGFDFFKNFIVKTNYVSKSISVYDPATYVPKKCRKCETFPLVFNQRKPYVTLRDTFSGDPSEHVLLVDSGSSDALWLFDQSGHIDSIQKNFFDDFLGLGLSGNVYGKRSKLPSFQFGSFGLDNVKVAFPDARFLENIRQFQERDGSIGGDLLKRFTVTMDYAGKKMTLKKNANFKTPFHYNMSGLVIEHDGMVLIRNFEDQNNATISNKREQETNGMVTINLGTIVTKLLAPRYVIAEVRKDSPADLAGLKIGDVVINVNGKSAQRYRLHELVAMFSSEAGKKISLQIERNGVRSTLKFKLKKVI